MICKGCAIRIVRILRFQCDDPGRSSQVSLYLIRIWTTPMLKERRLVGRLLFSLGLPLQVARRLCNETVCSCVIQQRAGQACSWNLPLWLPSLLNDRIIDNSRVVIAMIPYHCGLQGPVSV